jgi:hypothetical protein
LISPILPKIIKYRRITLAKIGDTINKYTIFVGIPHGKRQLGRPKCIREYMKPDISERR